MATPPSLFAPISRQIAEAGLSCEENENWRRFIFEKPFGRDLESAKQLNSDLLKIIKEDQIYRIDHYLGKETVQNILVFLFANGMFNRFGTAHSLTMFRSLWLKNSALNCVAVIMTMPELCGIWFRIIFFSLLH